MAVTDLGGLLGRSGAVTEALLAAAQRRAAVYGGTLDTALLEIGAVDERTLALALAQASGLPRADLERLGVPVPGDTDWLPVAEARRMGGVPLVRRPDAVEVAVHPHADPAAIVAFAASRGIAPVALAVVTEVRFYELLARCYGQPLSPRYSSLLAKLTGPDGLRRHRGQPMNVPRPVVETGPVLRPRPETPAPEIPEPEIDVTVEPPPPPPPAPSAHALLAALEAARSPQEVTRAIAALEQSRSPQSVPALIERLRDRHAADAAKAALVAITRQDFGTSRRAWTGWWRKAGDKERIEWLLEALTHKRADLRLAASQELQAATGVYFGYHFDLPERDREEARRRWTEWWRTIGRPRMAGQSRS